MGEALLKVSDVTKSFAEVTHRGVSFGVTYSQHPASALGTLDYQMSVGEVD